MSIVTIKHEPDNRREFGYGIYVNGYVTDDDWGEFLYASECVPFGQNTAANLKAAERRVRRKALAAYKRDYMQE